MYMYICTNIHLHIYIYMYIHIYIRRRKFSTNLSPSGRIRQVQNTTSCHNSGTMHLNSLEFVRCVATHRTNTLPAIQSQRAPVQIQTHSESPGATLPFPLRYIYTMHICKNIYIYVYMYIYT